MNGMTPIEIAAAHIIASNPSPKSWNELSAAAKYASQIVVPLLGSQHTSRIPSGMLRRIQFGATAVALSRRPWNPQRTRNRSQLVANSVEAIFPAGHMIAEYIQQSIELASARHAKRKAYDVTSLGRSDLISINGSKHMAPATEAAKVALAQMRAAGNQSLIPTTAAIEKVVGQEMGIVPKYISTAIRASYRTALQTLP